MAKQVGIRAYNPVEVPLGKMENGELVDGKVYESVDLVESDEKEFLAIFEGLNAVADSYTEPDGEGGFRAVSKTQEEQDADAAKVRELTLRGFDLILRPQDGGQSKPSTWLKKSLKEGTLTPRQFEVLWRDVMQAIKEANSQDGEGDVTRPT